MSGIVLEIKRLDIKSPCGFNGLAGVDNTVRLFGAEAKVSFMPKTNQYSTITTLEIEGVEVSVIKHVPSLYINGMVNFFVKFKEPS